MTKENSWRNGVMKKSDGSETVEPAEDIPMHEQFPKANEGTDVNGKVGPVALKYTNTTPVATPAANATEPAANSTVAANTTASANATTAANATAAANTTAASNTTAAANATATATPAATEAAAANATTPVASLATSKSKSRNTTEAAAPATPARLTNAEIAARIEAAAEARWVEKTTADAEAKAKYEALKDEVAANMTRDNSWRNGVMTGGPTPEPTTDIPMHERLPLANQAENVNGKMGPAALKYTNTTAAANATALVAKKFPDSMPAVEATKGVQSTLGWLSG